MKKFLRFLIVGSAFVGVFALSFRIVGQALVQFGVKAGLGLQLAATLGYAAVWLLALFAVVLLVNWLFH